MFNAKKMLKRYYTILVVIVLGVSLTITAAWAWSLYLKSEQQSEFDKKCLGLVSAMQSKIQRGIFLVQETTAYFNASEYVSRDEFRKFTSLIMKNYDSAQAIEWVPMVRQNDVAQYVADARKTYPNFAIKSQVEGGHLLKGGHKDKYFPVYYVEPLVGNEAALGFDLSSNRARMKALVAAANAGEIFISDPVHLVQMRSGSFGVLMFSPVYQNEGLKNMKERFADLNGFVVGVFEINKLFTSVLGDSQSHQVQILISEGSASSRKVVYGHSIQQASVHYLEYQSSIKVLNKTWHIRVIEPLPNLGILYDWLTYMIVLIGLVLSALISVYLYALIDRNNQINKNVELKTRDLARLNKELLEEISAHQLSENKLSVSEQHNRMILDAAGEGIFGLNQNGCVTFINPSALKMLGYELDEILGQSMHSVIHHSLPNGELFPREKCSIYAAYTKGETNYIVDEVLWRKDGTSFPVKYTSTPIRQNGKLSGAVVTFSDISVEVKSKKRLIQLARMDHLTNLPNRANFDETLKQTVRFSEQNNQAIALIYMDIDAFKDINDTLGHRIGDKLLKQFANRIQDHLGSDCFFARVGGDEFAVILSGLIDKSQAMVLAEKILDAASESFHIENHELKVKISVGMAVYPESATDSASIRQCADIAMFRAKSSERAKVVMYDEEIARSYTNKLQMARDLHVAIDRNELFLLYQPQYDLVSEKIIGVEVLLRWQHHQLGLISPEEFIGLAEEIGEIERIGLWVLDNACRQYDLWRKSGVNLDRCAINVSPKQLFDTDFIDLFTSTLSKYEIDSNLIEIEITESQIMESGFRLEEILKPIYDMGVKIFIDDFGTGFSSLGRLKNLPVNGLKIDKSFVADLPGDQDDGVIVRTIINLASSLSLAVIAEGVETRAQLEFLIENGCKQGQGFLWCKPVNAQEIETMVKESR